MFADILRAPTSSAPPPSVASSSAPAAPAAPVASFDATGTAYIHPGDDIEATLSQLQPGDHTDVTLVLRSGVHRLRRPLQVTRPGLRLIGDPGARLSGGVDISTWIDTRNEASPQREPLLTADVSHLLPPLPELAPRQLWIRGVSGQYRRAARPRLPAAELASWHAGQYNEMMMGYSVRSLAPLNWSSPPTAEFVYSGQGSRWSESRCTVHSVTRSGAAALISMRKCFGFVRYKPCHQGSTVPDHIENAGMHGGLLPGEWYIEHREGATPPPQNALFPGATSLLHYAPLPGETASSVRAVLPLAEALVTGTEDAHRVELHNLTFEHTTWLQPSGNAGYVEQQAGALIGPGSTCDDKASWPVSRGTVHFERARSVRVVGCVFRHLGTSAAVRAASVDSQTAMRARHAHAKHSSIRSSGRQRV